jgi:hypothetical protein
LPLIDAKEEPRYTENLPSSENKVEIAEALAIHHVW